MLRSLSDTIRVLGSMPSPPSAGLAETIISALRAGDGRRAASTLLPVGARARWRARRWAQRRLTSSRPQLRRVWLRVTLPIGLLLGAALSFVNQGEMLLSGQIDLRMCVVCVLDFLLPLAALSALLLAVASWAGRRS